MKKNLLCFLCGSLILLNNHFEVYGQAIQSTTEYQEAIQALGQAKYEQAFETISPLITNTRYRGAALVEMGRIRKKQAEAEMTLANAHFNEAADYMNSGLASNGVSGSEIPKALFDLGIIYAEKLNNYVQAQDCYIKIIEQYPTYLAIDKVYYNLAVCEEAMGMYEEAAAHYQKIVSDYTYSTFFAAAQEKTRTVSRGTTSAESAIESQENWADDKAYTEEGAKANLELGDMQADAGKYKQAANAYRNAIRDANTQEEGVEAYRKLVSMLDEKQKDYKKAAETIEEMLDAYPNASGNEDMIYKLGQIYENDIDSMKKRVIDGQVRYKKSDESNRKAIEYYDTVTNKYPDSQVAADAYIHKGKIYEDLKEYSEAKSEYQRYLREFPNHPDVESIRKKLKDLEGY